MIVYVVTVVMSHLTAAFMSLFFCSLLHSSQNDPIKMEPDHVIPRDPLVLPVRFRIGALTLCTPLPGSCLFCQHHPQSQFRAFEWVSLLPGPSRPDRVAGSFLPFRFHSESIRPWPHSEVATQSVCFPCFNSLTTCQWSVSPDGK